MKILKKSFCIFITLSLILSAFAACTDPDDGKLEPTDEPSSESSTYSDLTELPFVTDEPSESSSDSTPEATPEATPEENPEESPKETINESETLPEAVESNPDTDPGTSETTPEIPESTLPDAESTPAESSSIAPPPVTPSSISIKFNGSGYSVSVKGVVSVSGNVLTITKAGTYILSGTLDNAQLRVAVEKTEKVTLILDGVSITNKVSAPLYIDSADKVSIELAENTTNTFTDAKTYYFPEGEDKPNACIYSSEDLTIKGDGALIVKAYYNNGIGSKNDLKIKSGNINVEAANNALKGNQSVTIEGGNITLKGSDGIKSDSTLEGEGVVDFIAGTVNITAGDDGIQAVTRVTVSADALVTVNAADKDINCEGIVDKQSGSFISK